MFSTLCASVADPDPGYWWPKIEKNRAEKINFSLGLHKGRPSYTRSLQPSKKTSTSTSKNKNFNFFLLLWVIFTLLDPDPDPGNPTRIRIRNIAKCCRKHKQRFLCVWIPFNIWERSLFAIFTKSQFLYTAWSLKNCASLLGYFDVPRSAMAPLTD